MVRNFTVRFRRRYRLDVAKPGVQRRDEARLRVDGLDDHLSIMAAINVEEQQTNPTCSFA